MKIVIASDCHNNFDNLERLIELANEAGCKLFLYAGDFTLPEKLSLLSSFDGKVEMVWGNRDLQKNDFVRELNVFPQVNMHGNEYKDEIDGIQIYMTHYPEQAEKAARSGNYDLVVHGHTHDFRQELIGETVIVNPGNLKGEGEGATYIILDTEAQGISFGMVKSQI